MRGATQVVDLRLDDLRNFNPRTPCGVRLVKDVYENEFGQKISIHAPHAGCDGWQYAIDGTNGISIHAPHAGCDGVCCDVADVLRAISIHAPHAGCDMGRTVGLGVRWISIHAPHAGCDSMVKIFRFYRRFQRHFREAENLPCTYRGFSQFFLLLASPSRYRIIVSLGS